MFDIDRVEYTAARIAERHREAEIHRRLTRPEQHPACQPTGRRTLAGLWHLAVSRLGLARTQDGAG